MGWLIYRHVNKINGKCYVGQTKQTTILRWGKNGKGYNSHGNNHFSVFFNAIQKYGWDNFEHVTLEENIETKQLANQREMYWINFYRSYIGFEDCNGYNMTLGGQTGEHLGYKVYQISKKDLSIIAEFSSTAEASRKFGKQVDAQIRRCCEGLKPSCKGFFWCYVKNYTKDWKPKRNELVSSVFQIDDDLNIIRKYDSITECVKITGFSGGSIVSCCRRKQRKANGYFWCYELDYNVNWQPTVVKFNRNEKIYCFETDTEYTSAKIASQKTGANAGKILRACRGLENGANGLHFCFTKDKENYTCNKTVKRGDIYNETENNLIRSLYPTMGISKEFLSYFPNRSKGSLIQQVSRLGLKYNGRNKHCKKVINIELNKIFNSIEEAARFIGLQDGSSIGQCCLGKKKRAAGYHWMYYDDYFKNGFIIKEER